MGFESKQIFIIIRHSVGINQNIIIRSKCMKFHRHENARHLNAVFLHIIRGKINIRK